MKLSKTEVKIYNDIVLTLKHSCLEAVHDKIQNSEFIDASELLVNLDKQINFLKKHLRIE